MKVASGGATFTKEIHIFTPDKLNTAMIKRLFLAFGLMVTAVCGGSAQEVNTDVARHDFFYAGQSKQRRMFIVKADR